MENQPREKGIFEKFEEFTSMTSALEKNFALEDLLTPAFLKAYTEFPSLEAFLDACGGPVKDVDGLVALEDTSFLKKTKFETVDAMLNKAMECYIDAFFAE